MSDDKPPRARKRGNGVGKGDGWGGPAKGAMRGGPPQPFEPGNTAAVGHGPPDWDKLADDDARAAALKAHVGKLALTAEREETQLNAAQAWLNRHEGMPIARTVNANMSVRNMTREQVLDRIGTLARTLGIPGPDGATDVAAIEGQVGR